MIVQVKIQNKRPGFEYYSIVQSGQRLHKVHKFEGSGSYHCAGREVTCHKAQCEHVTALTIASVIREYLLLIVLSHSRIPELQEKGIALVTGKKQAERVKRAFLQKYEVKAQKKGTFMVMNTLTSKKNKVKIDRETPEKSFCSCEDVRFNRSKGDFTFCKHMVSALFHGVEIMAKQNK